MNTIIMGLTLFPLQPDVSYFNIDAKNSSNALTLVLGIVIVAMLLIILNAVKGRYNKKNRAGGKHTAQGGPRQFSSFTLHRITGDLGLDREQVKMLEYVMKSGGINDPERFLNSPAMVDQHFKRTYRLIERTYRDNNEELNERISVLFATRNIIDSNTRSVTATSSRQVPEKAPAVLTIDKINYPVQVISSRGDTLLVECPKRTAGSPIRPMRGSKATIAFFTRAIKGFSVESRVLGTIETANGLALQLSHSGQIKRLSSRRFRRRQITREAAFFFVQLDTKNKKMTVEKRRLSGTMTDISIGGCSIRTTTQVRSGQRIKVEFTHTDGSTLAALGEVLRSSRNGVSMTIHVRFLRVPRKALNVINAIVYEYTET